MPAQYWDMLVPPYLTADGTAVTASATLTELTPTPQIILPYPILQEFAGKRLRFDAWGHYTTTGTQGTITFDLKMGAAGAVGSMTSIITSAAITWVASQTNRFWHIEGGVTIRTVGAAGTAVGFMDISNVSLGSADVPGVVAGTTAGSTAAVDTTSARAIALAATISVASQSITCREFRVYAVN